MFFMLKSIVHLWRFFMQFEKDGSYKFDKAASEIKKKNLSKSMEASLLTAHGKCKTESTEMDKEPKTKGMARVAQVQFYQSCVSFLLLAKYQQHLTHLFCTLDGLSHYQGMWHQDSSPSCSPCTSKVSKTLNYYWLEKSVPALPNCPAKSSLCSHFVSSKCLFPCLPSIVSWWANILFKICLSFSLLFPNFLIVLLHWTHYKLWFIQFPSVST